MIIVKDFYGERATVRTEYVVKCDYCGAEHAEPGLVPADSVWAAQNSGWHTATLHPDDDWQNHPVACPDCREKADTR